jgi:hypothetical protein
VLEVVARHGLQKAPFNPGGWPLPLTLVVRRFGLMPWLALAYQPAGDRHAARPASQGKTWPTKPNAQAWHQIVGPVR